MNIQELLHSFPCTCGHEHRCDIRRVEIGRNAVSALAELCRDEQKKELALLAAGDVGEADDLQG